MLAQAIGALKLPIAALGDDDEDHLKFAEEVMANLQPLCLLRRLERLVPAMAPMLDRAGRSAEDTTRLRECVHEMKLAFDRTPAARAVLGAIEGVLEFLEDKALEEPRNQVLAGLTLAPWLARLADGLGNLDKLVALDEKRRGLRGAHSAILEALYAYERNLLDGRAEPKPPDGLAEADYGEWWSALVNYSSARAWQGKLETENPVLLHMTPEEHSSLVVRLSSLLREKRKTEAGDIISAHIAKQIPWRDKPWDSMFQLTSSYKNKSKRLREAVELGLPEGLLKMRPCWLTNPGAVSQIFPLTAGLFDFVIFDEASQCPIEQAIPSIYRGKTVVVAGDEHQMPPTSFFSSTLDETADAEEGEDEEASQSPAESHSRKVAASVREALMQAEDLLEAADKILPGRPLQVHYRSRHPALINFSNLAFYGLLAVLCG